MIWTQAVKCAIMSSKQYSILQPKMPDVVAAFLKSFDVLFSFIFSQSVEKVFEKQIFFKDY